MTYALHLGEGRLDLQERTTHRSRGVEGSVQRSEAHTTALQFVHEADQFAGQAPEAVEVEHDQHIAAPEVIQARLESGPVGAGPAAAVVKDALAASRPERVHLAVEHLALLSGGHPRVADQLHRSPTPACSQQPR